MAAATASAICCWCCSSLWATIRQRLSRSFQHSSTSFCALGASNRRFLKALPAAWEAESCVVAFIGVVALLSPTHCCTNRSLASSFCGDNGWGCSTISSTCWRFDGGTGEEVRGNGPLAGGKRERVPVAMEWLSSYSLRSGATASTYRLSLAFKGHGLDFLLWRMLFCSDISSSYPRPMSPRQEFLWRCTRIRTARGHISHIQSRPHQVDESGHIRHSTVTLSHSVMFGVKSMAAIVSVQWCWGKRSGQRFLKIWIVKNVRVSLRAKLKLMSLCLNMCLHKLCI